MTAPTALNNGYSPAALEYLRSHAIDPAVAHSCGVSEDGGALRYPDGRRRPLHSNVTLQPRGKPLRAWWIRRDGPSELGLVCEGEGDGLAAATHLPHTPPAAGLRSVPVLAIPGCGFPAERLVAELVEAGVSQALLALDGDEAGRKYADKASAALRAAGIQPALVELPDGADLADCLAAEDDPPDWLANVLVDAGCAAESLEPTRAPIEDAAELLSEVERCVRRYVIVSDAQAAIVALWLAHTHAITSADTTPYLAVLTGETIRQDEAARGPPRARRTRALYGERVRRGAVPVDR